MKTVNRRTCRSNSYRGFIAFAIAWVVAGYLPVACAEDQPLRPEQALAWQPKDYPEATLHARIPFLQPAREWERMDVWVPNEPSDKKLPCVVAVYGGGYGDKVGGFIKDVRPLLKRGFVVAAPDYALKTNAAVPLCSWDVANAIRFLRANAERYRIDPERIGIWGWSAGGWIAQDLCYTGPERIVRRPLEFTPSKKVDRWFPMLEPRPQFAEQSVRVQAVVSDWGAGKLWDRRAKTPQAWVSPDDPPLLTCFNGELTDETINPVTLLKKLGVPSRGVYGIQGNTHVPKLATAAVHEDGRATTWGDSIYEFFEQQLKTIETATAPEMHSHGGSISGPTQVRLLTVHPSGSIHYTLDGTTPNETSPKFKSPIEVNPNQVLKAVAVRAGLKPSRITTGQFVAGPRRPLITTKQRTFEATVGKPFRVEFQAENADTAQWFVGGKVGWHYREFKGERFNPPKHIAWLSINAATGVLSCTPATPGTYPIIVSCMTNPVGQGKTRSSETGDALLVVIHVSK